MATPAAAAAVPGVGVEAGAVEKPALAERVGQEIGLDQIGASPHRAGAERRAVEVLGQDSRRRTRSA